MKPVSVPANPAALIYGLFFISGCAGLILELVWFRLAALSFGSTVWAATAVLSAFMGGLALGNGLAARFAARLGQPLRIYSLAEFTVAGTGLALLWILPGIGSALGPWALPILEAGGGWPLQGLRFAAAFLLMLLPTTAMGLTLPLLVQQLDTGEVAKYNIHRLYGWNTLGALTGILLAETLLIQMTGLAGSALAAALLCLAAAAGAWRLNRRGTAPAPDSTPRHPLALRLWLAAGLTGLLMLALEVVWFRLLLLHLRGTATAFAGMLAIVLGSMALGSLLAAALMKRRPPSWQLAFWLAAGCVASIPLGYASLNLPLPVWLRACLLMAPCALASGALLPTLAALHVHQHQQAASAAGRLWLINTAGSALGAAVCGLWLLPTAGMETSLLILGLGYVAVTLCLLPPGRAWGLASLCLLMMTGYAAFPQGLIQAYLAQATAVYQQLDNSRVLARREGLNETVQLLERRLFGEPFSYRLVTDGYSMSGTERDSQRYMKLFAWLPQSLHTAPEKALLISYGVGTTAHALLDDPALQALTVVDLSADVLAMSPLIHGSDDPLQDARVSIKIEDGRQFLLLSKERFDLITAEPPPPRMKGVVNLYTREYFQLIHERLKPGGLSSYWLPVDQLTLGSAQAITSAFCAVFKDCSLWAGSNYNWILLGGKQAFEPVAGDTLVRPWTFAAENLKALGLEEPALLGLTFLADHEQLHRWYGDTAPLTDHWPKRLSEQQASKPDIQAYAAWADNLVTQQRFAESLWIRERFPAAWRQRALAQFDLQPIFNNELPPDPLARLPLVNELLQSARYQTPVYWLLGSGMAEQRLIDQLLEKQGYRSEFAYDLGVRALVQENFGAAASLFREALSNGETRALGPAIYSLCRNNMALSARTLARKQNKHLPIKCWD